MKLLRPLLVGLLALAFFFTQTPKQSDALFHLSVIDEVVTSYGGDPDVQFVEIAMETGSQNFVQNSILGAFDVDGDYLGDVLVVPSNVPNSGNGVRWLMATSEFQTLTGLTPDFTMPAGLLTGGGMVCWGAPGVSVPPPGSWDHTNPNNYVDCIAYGTYSGPTNNHIGNPTPLTGDGHSLQRIAHTDDNLSDIICGDPATPRNNAGSTVNMAATTSCNPDSDGDGVDDLDDDCPGTAPAAPVDVNGCSDAQVDGDDDGICDPGAPSAGPSACQLSPADNCPDNSNPGQEDLDGDDVGNVCDSDDDGDLVSDADETGCSSDPANGADAPEKVGNSTDDDGDTLTDEVESPVTGFDCDGDGAIDNREAALTWPATAGSSPESGADCLDGVDDDPLDDPDEMIGSFTNPGIVNDGCPGGVEHQARCNATVTMNDEADEWPWDFNDSGTLNLADALSFSTAMQKHFGGVVANHGRWNLVASGPTINLQDVLAIIGSASMFEGEKAFGNTMWGTAGKCPAD
jgi:hypothetical protein